MYTNINISHCLQPLYNNKTKINLYKVKPNLMQISKIHLMQYGCYCLTEATLLLACEYGTH